MTIPFLLRKNNGAASKEKGLCRGFSFRRVREYPRGYSRGWKRNRHARFYCRNKQRRRYRRFEEQKQSGWNDAKLLTKFNKNKGGQAKRRNPIENLNVKSRKFSMGLLFYECHFKEVKSSSCDSQFVSITYRRYFVSITF